MGRKILAKDFNNLGKVQVDISNFTKGMYIIKLVDGKNNVSNAKFIKQ